MAASIKLGEESFTPFNDFHAVFTKFNYATSGDTVEVPRGCVSAAVLVGSGTAPTTSISAGADSDTVTLTGGTTGSNLVLVTRHGGNPASVR